jgi:hypothetical protein
MMLSVSSLIRFGSQHPVERLTELTLHRQLTIKIWDFYENHGGDHTEIVRHAIGAPERFAAKAREQDLLAEVSTFSLFSLSTSLCWSA